MTDSFRRTNQVTWRLIGIVLFILVISAITDPAKAVVTQITDCAAQGQTAGCITPSVIQQSVCANSPGLCKPVTGTVVNLACGATLSTSINASSPSGTIYQLAGNATTPCTYSGQTFSTNNNITIQGDCSSPVGANTILDGGNGALTLTDGKSDGKTGVTIKCLTVQHYRTHTANCLNSGFTTYDGWLVKNNSILNNGCVGLDIKGNATVRNNLISGNASEGVFIETSFSAQSGWAATSELSSNEVASNGNVDGVANTAGGVKVVPDSCTQAALATQGTRVIANYVHDNIGSGIWTDCWATSTLISNNTVARNTIAGIMVEISVGADVSHNILLDNDFNDTLCSQCWQGCVYVLSSANVNVHDNYCSVNAAYGGAFYAEAACRSDAPAAALIGNLKNVVFKNNTIDFPVVTSSPHAIGITGSQDDTTASASTSYGALCASDTHPANAGWAIFKDNTYYMPTVSSTPFSESSCGIAPNFTLAQVQGATGSTCLSTPAQTQEIGSTVIAGATAMNAVGGCALSAAAGGFCTSSGW